MDSILRELRHLVQAVAHRLSQFLADAPAGSLQITGVLGLAAVLYGIYQLQGSARSKRDPLARRQDPRELNPEASSSGLRQQTDAPRRRIQQPEAGSTSSRFTGNSNYAKEKGVSWGRRSHMAGVKSLTISAPGVLLEERTASQLQDAATLKADAAKVLSDIAQFASVYIITQVEDDTGEATCRGALEAGGLVGTSPGQIPAHRLLFCGTLDGKVSIVRQLEPQLHVDSHPKTIEDLKRFIKSVHVRDAGQPSAGLGSPNVGYAESLVDLFSGQ